LRARKYFVAMAVATLIAGCGGGDESASITPQNAAAALRAQGSQGAIKLAATTADSADQLLDYAESHLPNFFPSHQPTQAFAPFKFRYYPETGIYLGVVVTAGMGYTLNGVYVAGGGLGTLANPLYVGLLTDYITPTTGGGGTASACYDLALADVQGTTITVGYKYSGTITGNQTVTATVGGLVTFEGHQARETTTTTTGTNTTQGFTVSVNTTGKVYTARTGDAEVTTYGATFVASGAGYSSSIRSVYTPPAVTRVYSLAQGASITETESGTVTSTTVVGFGQPDIVNTTQFSSTTTTKYVGQESVTVPAGTYNACKFEVTSSGSNDVTTNWFVVGKGFHVKSVAGGSVPQTIEATSIKLNGAAQ